MTELDRIRAQYPPTDVLGLSVLGVHLRVHTNDARVAAGLGDYFAPYRSTDAAAGALPVFVIHGEPVYDPARMRDVPRGERSVKEATYDAADARIVLKRRTGVTIYIAEPEHYAVGDMTRDLHQAVNAISMVFTKAMLRRGYVMLHASAGLGEDGGIAFAAPSGTGKSTMALALLDDGYQFVTNDRLLVRPAGGVVEMVGVPKIPRVSPGTLLRLPKLTSRLPQEARLRYERMAPEVLWAVEEKREVPVDAVYGPGTLRLAGRLRIVYVLQWKPGGTGWEVRPLEGEERTMALRRMSKGMGVYDPHPPAPGEPQRLLDAVGGTIPVHAVTGAVDIPGLRAFILDRSVRHAPCS